MIIAFKIHLLNIQNANYNSLMIKILFSTTQLLLKLCYRIFFLHLEDQI